MTQTKHTPEACSISDVTIDGLKNAIANASHDKRTGAAFVNIDTRVLAALIAPVRNAAPELLAALADMVEMATHHAMPEDERLIILRAARTALAKARGEG
jgi:hypothetical protein